MKDGTPFKTAGENINDSLQIAILLNGLPGYFKTFSPVINQKKEYLKLSEFKSSL